MIKYKLTEKNVWFAKNKICKPGDIFVRKSLIFSKFSLASEIKLIDLIKNYNKDLLIIVAKQDKDYTYGDNLWRIQTSDEKLYLSNLLHNIRYNDYEEEDTGMRVNNPLSSEWLILEPIRVFNDKPKTRFSILR